jgi:hypothetical protein
MMTFVILSLSWASAQSTNLTLRVTPPDPNHWFRFHSDGYHAPDSGTNFIYNVEASDDLTNWVEIARIHRIPSWIEDRLGGTR